MLEQEKICVEVIIDRESKLRLRKDSVYGPLIGMQTYRTTIEYDYFYEPGPSCSAASKVLIRENIVAIEWSGHDTDTDEREL